MPKDQEERINILKNLIESKFLTNFKDIFLYIPKTEASKRMGINYKTFVRNTGNPKKLRYEFTQSLAKIIDVPPISISQLIHNQIDTKKPDRKKYGK